MVIYALIVYALMSVAIVLSCVTFYKPSFYFYSPLLKIAFSCGIFALCLFPLSFSISSFFYVFFDIPSFSILILSIVSIVRFFLPSIRLMIGYRGFIALFAAWFFLSLNSLDIWVCGYVGLSDEILVATWIIALIYCIDRLCAVMLLIACMLWLLFPNMTDIYDGLFDPIVAIFGFCMQTISPSKAVFMKFSRV
ncbi:hypothetical protein CQA66_06300 [Helicobacter aurati]|uniref:Uncharacterized protein n=1 Tax=Helicobacter aurati TaxID=137778 RepID=A0A3D8J227_9HELI|nr:hypothetical protein [Helicobacter aurati]RDU71567.1 hypothetical protein CQA66_06300 [Helicobacter aurati]